MLTLLSRPPASTSSTLWRASAVRRFATAQPAEPDPTTMKSNSALSGTDETYMQAFPPNHLTDGLVPTRWRLRLIMVLRYSTGPPVVCSNVDAMSGAVYLSDC